MELNKTNENLLLAFIVVFYILNKIQNFVKIDIYIKKLKVINQRRAQNQFS